MCELLLQKKLRVRLQTIGARERAQAARLLHRRHLVLLAGRLALRHVVHLHMVVDSFGC